MTITTSQRFNMDTVQAALPSGASFACLGEPTQAAPKTVTFYGTDDGTGQAALTTATGQFVDREANKATLLAKLPAALTANATYLALASPTVAQNTAQTQRLTREWNALARIVAGLVDDTSGT